MNIVSFLNKVNQAIINPLLTVLFAVTMLYLVWSVIQLINADAAGKEAARKSLMYTVIGIFVMISVYGIINLVLGTFNIGGSPSTTYIQGKL